MPDELGIYGLAAAICGTGTGGQALVPCPANSRSQTFELAEDRLGRRDPDEGGGRGIVVRDEPLERLDQLCDAVERAALDGPFA